MPLWMNGGGWLVFLLVVLTVCSLLADRAVRRLQ